MVLASLLLLQAAQPAPAPAATQPDIQLDLRATARRVTVQKEGRAELQVRASVNGREGEGNVVDVDAPELPQGRATVNNVAVRVRAEARIPAPDQAASGQEPAQPK
jgi:hypothetical protein